MRLLRAKPPDPSRRQKGQAAVEFALIVPIFLIVLFIIVDFGVGLSNWISLTNATREGARYGAVGASSDEIRQRVLDKSTQLIGSDLDPSQISVEYVDSDGDGSVDRGESVVVRTTYDYDLITPLRQLMTLTFGSITFNSCADMRLELGVTGASGGGSAC